MAEQPSQSTDRGYCPVCGEIFSASNPACPNCGAPRRDPPVLDTASLASVLTDFPTLPLGNLPAAARTALRADFERLLLERRPVRADSPAPTAPVPSPPPVRPPPAAARGPSLGEWTAARQADILLYLGAFLLSVAALVFIGYQGEALSGPARFAVLLAYTVAFLALGFSLPRWRRVREAGGVFLALGALLLPINFLAFRVLVLGSGSLPDSAIWLAGSLVASLLYLALGLRGRNRFYLGLSAIAALVAWGSLGVVAALPEQWFGTWFLVPAAGIDVLWATANLRGRPLAGIFGILLGSLALSYAHIAALISSATSAQLPIAYGLATAGALAAAYRTHWGNRLLVPALAAMTASTALWALGLPAWSWEYPWPAACLAVLAAEPWWRKQEGLSRAGWQYLLALAVLPPLMFVPVYRYGNGAPQGIFAFLLATAVVFVIALRSRGAFAAPERHPLEARTLVLERRMLTYLATVFLFGAATFFNLWIAADGASRAWVYAAIGLAAWLGLAAGGRPLPDLYALLTPLGMAGVILGALLAWQNAAEASLVLLLGAGGALVAFPSARRWTLFGLAAAFLEAALVFAWRWQNLDPTLLPLALLVVAATLLLGFAGKRDYGRDERSMVIAALSWVPGLLPGDDFGAAQHPIYLGAR